MKKILGILQPGRMGDIVISLPIAKYYFDMGYKVVWPLASPFIPFFTSAVDYVQFIPVRHSNMADTANWHSEAENILNEFDCDVKLDLLFNMTNTDKASSEWKKSGLKFDEYRYTISNVPFEEKWNLQINRNLKRETELYNSIVKNEKYVVYQFNGAGFSRGIKIENPNNYQLIEIKPITNNPFDWLTVLEKSCSIIVIDSVFANIVEQLNMSNKKYFLLRSPDIMTPKLKNEWRIL